jgi:hypothetical protein
LPEKEAGWGPRGSERRGWRRAGPAGGHDPVGREASGWAWEEAAQERTRGSGSVAGRTGRAEKGRRTGRNRCSGLKSKEVKENQILMDFWIKIGLEIE